MPVAPAPPPPAVRGPLRWAVLGVPALTAALLFVAAPVLHTLRITPPPSSGRLAALEAEEAYLTAHGALRETGRAGLVIDLAAGRLVLEHAGVPLRDVPILAADASRALRRDAPRLYVLTAEWATLPKEPIQVVEAPRDTVEAQARPPQTVPDAPPPAAFVLRFDGGLVVEVRPDSAGTLQRVRGAALGVAVRASAVGRAVAALARGEAPPAERRIRIVVPAADATALYRGLPAGAGLVIRHTAAAS